MVRFEPDEAIDFFNGVFDFVECVSGFYPKFEYQPVNFIHN